MTVFRTAYGERFRVVTEFFKPSMAKQSFKDECDINRVMDRWLKTGVLVHVNKFHGDYSDVSNFPEDLQAAYEQIRVAEEAFGSLPSLVRKKFRNDPAAFLDFVSKEENREEMYELGLAQRPGGVAGPKGVPEGEVAAVEQP